MRNLVFELGQRLLRGGREFAARGAPSAAPGNAAPNAPGDASAPLVPRAWLHIRSGVHRGGAVALHDGLYRIGASLDDDVVLRDAHMLADHLHIDVDARGLRFTAHAPGWIDGDAALEPGTPLDAPCTTWHLPRCLQLGDTRIELNWGPTAPSPAGQAPTLPRAAGVARQWGLTRKPALIVAAGMAAAGLLATFAFILMGSGPAALRANPAGSDALQAAQQQLKAHAEWQNVVLKRSPALGAELRGSVEQRDDLNRLLRVPEVAALMPLVRVVIGQDLRRQIQDLAGDPAIQVEITPVPAQEPSAQASPAHSPVDQAGNAAAKTAAAPDARQRVVVTGTTTRPDVAASLKMLNIEFGGRIEIVDRTVYELGAGGGKKVRAELPFKIASVNAGEGYIENTDGEKYFEGSVVSGYRVESIERQKVVFSVNGKRIDFPVN